MSSSDHKFSAQTRALKHRIDIAETFPATTPLFQSSAFEANSPYFYTRKANPNVKEFEDVIAILEDAKFATGVSTGMAAIQVTLNLLKPGETLVINSLIYGCSYKHFHRFSERLGLKLVVLDLSTEEGMASIPTETSMIFLETPTNPFLKTIDLKKLLKEKQGKAIDAIIVVDNTWAGPLCQQPLKFGADVSLHSATKYFSGHSDVMGGVVITNDPKLDAHFKDERFYGGCIMDPHSGWLLRRSLQTFELRTREQEKVAIEMMAFLKDCSQVKKVYYPDVDGEQLTGYPGILFFELQDSYGDVYEKFRDALQLFGTGTGMACVTSMVAQPHSGSHASMSDDEKATMGVGKNLIRLCFGLEKADDLKLDITEALKALD